VNLVYIVSASLSGDAVSFVRRYVGDYPEFVSFFRRAFIPDELSFQTILVSSELRSRIVNYDLRHMRWTAIGAGPGSPPCRRLRSLA
jgi:hypothetical protein